MTEAAETPEKKSVLTELREMRLQRLAKAQTDKKKPLPRVLLPTIQEDNDTHDEEYDHMNRERSNARKNVKPLGYGSENDCSGKKKQPNGSISSRGLVKKLVRKMESDDSEIHELRSHRIQSASKSSQAAKELLNRLNQIKAPKSRGNCSDSTEDTVHSRIGSGKAKSQGRQVPKNVPSEKYVARTPTHVAAVQKPRNLAHAK